ncbi:MAG TPA: methylamine utilization protein MauG [Rhodospirillaceae bacterium]|mgnify:CR=1 FL=1|nr:methylamine utilization protein MauG [Rhodospirillaceae bacterium]
MQHHVSFSRRLIFTALVLSLSFAAAPARATDYATAAELGKALFFDPNLSKNRTQACATCHNPANAFTDPRETAVGRAVSLGDDGTSLGDRNTPTAAYAKFAPKFQRLKDGRYVGGQFLDGREPDLAGQAGGPPLNPIEMGMPDKASVVKRLWEYPPYVTAFAKLFGPKVTDDTDAAYAAMTQAIAAFEQTEEFAPFDSKYDRFLKGEAKLTDQEELGRLLFFSQQFTNCNQCHQLHAVQPAKGETFTNYQFHNIGIPVNTAVRQANGSKPGHIDHGLLDNPAVTDKAQDGKFKVPTLRNVAVTGPYMHNGVFKDLRTTVLFYNRYNTKDPERLINPETGKPFRAPEVPATLSVKELTHGPALDDKRIDALVAFMKTLTDRRYEALLEK